MKRRTYQRAGSLLAVSLGYAGLFLISHELGDRNPRAAIAILISVLAVNAAYCVLYFVNEFRHDLIISGRLRLSEVDGVERRRRYLKWHWVVVASLSQLFVFSFLFDHFYRLGGDRHFSFERQITYLDWLLYTVDCAFKGVFDVTEIFDLHLRNIQHHGLVGGGIVLVVRLFIYSLLMATLIRQGNKWRLLRETVTAVNNAPRLAGSRLIRMGKEALPHLRHAIQKPNLFVSDHEKETLVCDEHSRPVVELLNRNLQLGTPDERHNCAVMFGLLALEDHSSRPYFIELAQAARHDSSLEVRLEAIHSLGRIPDARTLLPLRALLRDPEPQVRAEAARSLGHRTDHDAVGALARQLKDQRSAVRVAAIRALGRIGHRGALPALREALLHADARVRREAVFSLAHLRCPEVGQKLFPLLRDREPRIRRKAVESLAILRPEGSIDALVRLLGDDDSTVRRLTTEVLGQLDSERAAREVISSGADPDSSVRRVQVAVVSAARNRATLPFLERAARDADAIVRERAIHALAAVASARPLEVGALDALLRIVSKGSTEDRLHAIQALGDAQVEDAYDALLRAARTHGDLQVRRQATRALRQISAERAARDLDVARRPREIEDDDEELPLASGSTRSRPSVVPTFAGGLVNSDMVRACHPEPQGVGPPEVSRRRLC